MSHEQIAYYTLDGRTPVPCDRQIWVAWAVALGDAGRELGRTAIASEHVVTEFPGFLRPWDGGLFWTRVFGLHCAGLQRWADDWAGAQRNHGDLVRRVRQELATREAAGRVVPPR